MKCRGCLEDKPLEEFPTRNDRSNRRRPYCYSCGSSRSRATYKGYKNNSPFKWKCTKIKARANSLNVPFDLTPEYLESIWTGICPVSGNELIWDADRSNPNAAELDRIIPSLGYVKGNVAFLSRRINKIKSDATYGEIIKLGDWLGNYTY